MTCHFPILGVPFVATLDAVVSVNGSLSVSVSYQSQCNSGQACTGINASISVGGGVGATGLSGLIQGNLQLIGSASASGQWCFYPQMQRPTGNVNFGNLQVVGTISGAWGLVSHSIQFTVFNGFSQSF
jgi:hypothetical protein